MWSAVMNSFNHYAYSAVYDWVFTAVGGIDTDGPTGFKNILLRPLPGGPLSHVECTYESPYGTIHLRWEKTATGLKVDVTIPPNTTARLVLPNSEKVLGSGTYSVTEVL